MPTQIKSSQNKNQLPNELTKSSIFTNKQGTKNKKKKRKKKCQKKTKVKMSKFREKTKHSCSSKWGDISSKFSFPVAALTIRNN